VTRERRERIENDRIDRRDSTTKRTGQEEEPQRAGAVKDEKKKTKGKKDKKPFHQFVVNRQSSIVEKEVTEEPEPEEEIVKRQSSIVERAKESSRVAPEAVEQKKRILFVLNIRRPDR
jgi:hypothetical protein